MFEFLKSCKLQFSAAIGFMGQRQDVFERQAGTFGYCLGRDSLLKKIFRYFNRRVFLAV